MSAANDLQVLIDNLLDISHIESGKVDISETSCSLPDILWELESIVRAEAKIRQLELSVKCSGLAHENVFCDRQQLSQALMNLIGNALKFTPAGGKISVSIYSRCGIQVLVSIKNFWSLSLILLSESMLQFPAGDRVWDWGLRLPEIS